MSINIVIKATDGVLGMCDGRATTNRSLIDDSYVKMYQLSPLVLVLFVGHLLDYSEGRGGSNDAVLIHSLSDYFKQNSMVGVTEISKQMQMNMRANKDSLPPNTRFNVMLIGYDRLSETKYAPAIYTLSYNNEELQYSRTKIGVNHFVTGSGAPQVWDYLKEQIPLGDRTLKRMNQLAAKAMQMAIKAEPDVVGGQIMLYNITPGKPLKEFTPQEIEALV